MIASAAAAACMSRIRIVKLSEDSQRKSRPYSRGSSLIYKRVPNAASAT